MKMVVVTLEISITKSPSMVSVDPLASLDIFGQQRISSTGASPNEDFINFTMIKLV